MGEMDIIENELDRVKRDVGEIYAKLKSIEITYAKFEESSKYEIREVKMLLQNEMRELNNSLQGLRDAVKCLQEAPNRKFEKIGKTIGILVSSGALVGIVWGFVVWLSKSGIIK